MKKILSVILSSLFVVSMMFSFVSCDSEPYEVPPTVSVWDGKSVTTEWYTENPEAKEFVLGSASDLAGLAALVNGTEATRSTGAIEPVDFTGTTITLTSDIDLNNIEWTPIGNGSKGDDNPNLKGAFRGVFDGNNHKISNLNVKTNEENKGAGLFGLVVNATIKNVIVESGSVYSSKIEAPAAGIVAIVLGDENSKTIIENCVNKANVSSDGGDNASGILSNSVLNKGKVIIRKSINEGTISASSGSACGIFGTSYNTDIEIVDCTNIGKISVENGTSSYHAVGGIVAIANPGITIRDSKNKGVIGSDSSTVSGGIVGFIPGGETKIESSKNFGEVTAKISAGGIIGHDDNMSSASNCENSGKITSADRAGGIIGYGGGAFNKCKNTGSVYGKKAAGGVGGLIVYKSTFDHVSGGNAYAVISCDTTIENNGYKGRLIGVINNVGNDNIVDFILDDENGDEKDSMIGRLGLSGCCKMSVSNGMLLFNPPIASTYQSPTPAKTSYIVFKENSAWDFMEEDVVGKTFYAKIDSSGTTQEWELKDN